MKRSWLWWGIVPTPEDFCKPILKIRDGLPNMYRIEYEVVMSQGPSSWIFSIEYLNKLGRDYDTKYIVSREVKKYNSYVFALAKHISDFISMIVFLL